MSCISAGSADSNTNAPPLMGWVLICAGGFASCADDASDALAMSDGQVDYATCPHWRAGYNCEILTTEIFRMQQMLHTVLNVRILGDEHQPAGPLIQAVDGSVDEVNRLL
jgi:hypothetical protein